MQSVSSRIWTCVAVSISYDDNHYTTGTSIYTHLLSLELPFCVENYEDLIYILENISLINHTIALTKLMQELQNIH